MSTALALPRPTARDARLMQKRRRHRIEEALRRALMVAHQHGAHVLVALRADDLLHLAGDYVPPPHPAQPWPATPPTP